jgi:hypothetical protein
MRILLYVGQLDAGELGKISKSLQHRNETRFQCPTFKPRPFPLESAKYHEPATDNPLSGSVFTPAKDGQCDRYNQCVVVYRAARVAKTLSVALPNSNISDQLFQPKCEDAFTMIPKSSPFAI